MQDMMDEVSEIICGIEKSFEGRRFEGRKFKGESVYSALLIMISAYTPKLNMDKKQALELLSNCYDEFTEFEKKNK